MFVSPLNAIPGIIMSPVATITKNLANVLSRHPQEIFRVIAVSSELLLLLRRIRIPQNLEMQLEVQQLLPSPIVTRGELRLVEATKPAGVREDVASVYHNVNGNIMRIRVRASEYMFDWILGLG